MQLLLRINKPCIRLNPGRTTTIIFILKSIKIIIVFIINLFEVSMNNRLFLLLFFLHLSTSNIYALEPVVIGFDGTYGLKGATSAIAIERGAQVAIDEINESGGVLNGRQLKLITTDNRMSPPRGLENLKQLATDPNLVAVLGGRFSPVILKQMGLLHD